MTKKSPCVLVAAVSLSWMMAIPSSGCADPQAAGQRAGEVSRVIPAVSIARSGKTIPAAAKTAVNWQDLVNTQTNARARIALDDGSVLNVGSDSSIKVVKHDAGAQQTETHLRKVADAGAKDRQAGRKIRDAHASARRGSGRH
jgi:FecR protein